VIAASSTQQGRWEERVSATDWDSVRADLDAYGCGLTGPLLTPDEAAQIAALYDDDSRFRSTITMGRHRFGQWLAMCHAAVIRSGQRFTLALAFHDAA
jgi:hypothetical protein